MPEIDLSIVHHGSASNARQVALAFAEANLLNEIITTFAYDPNAKVWCYLDLFPSQVSNPIRNELSKRTWTIKDHKISTYPWYEVLRIFLKKTQLNKLLSVSVNQMENWGFALLDRLVARHHLDGLAAIYSYEDLASITFEEAKKRSVLCLYDLPIPYYQTTQQIMQEESENFPDLKDSIQTIDEPTWKLKRKQQEIELADHIFVASSITRKSLTDIGINYNKISVIPYGSPIDIFQPQPKSDDCFRVLSVGRISPLKGIHYLLEAWKNSKIRGGQLVLVGQNDYPKGWLEERYWELYQHIPAVSHFSLNQYYSEASIVVLPSLIDGFGLVVLEAMACGIPVIVTVNTGASDIVTDGVDGFVVPIRDVRAIREKLEWCASHPQELAEMGRAARRKAEELNWGLYRQRLVSKVRSLLPA